MENLRLWGGAGLCPFIALISACTGEVRLPERVETQRPPASEPPAIDGPQAPDGGDNTPPPNSGGPPPPPPPVVEVEPCIRPALPRVVPLDSAQVRATWLSAAPGEEAMVSALGATIVDGSDGLLLAESVIEAALTAAEPLAQRIAADGCGDNPTASCARNFASQLASELFVRPLSTEETDRFETLFQDEVDAGVSTSEAMAMVVQAVLLSPEVLFRTELGDDQHALRPYERARALSYGLGGVPPDPALRDAAAQGQLETPEQVLAQAERLLASPNTAPRLKTFIEDLFGSSTIPSLAKDPTVYPRWSEDLAEALGEQASRFIDYVLYEGDGTLDTLYTAPYAFIDRTIAEAYDLEVEGDGWQRVMTGNMGRLGLLLQPGFLATYAHNDRTDPIKRGHFVRESLMCQPIGALPEGALDNFPEQDETLTTREWLETVHTANDGCNSCHQYMDPIGFPMEQFDAMGAYRETQRDQIIDPSGSITAYLTLEDDIPVANAAELVTELAKLQETKNCFVDTWTSDLLGRDLETEDTCWVDAVRQSFGENPDIRAMAAAMAVELWGR